MLFAWTAQPFEIPQIFTVQNAQDDRARSAPPMILSDVNDETAMESKTMSTMNRWSQVFGLVLMFSCFSSCAHYGGLGGASCGPEGCGVSCETGHCGSKWWKFGKHRARGCKTKGCGVQGQLCEKCCFALTGRLWQKPNAVPDTLPLGSTIRAHDQVMQTNGEASDFIFHRHDFVAQTAHLTPDAKDKIVEVASRMRSTPFPVLVERSENNSNPELDALRRNIVAQILTDFGNADAQQRTIVSTPYGPGYTGQRAERMYYQHVGFRNNFNNNNNNGGGFGGGGFGGGF